MQGELLAAFQGLELVGTAAYPAGEEEQEVVVVAFPLGAPVPSPRVLVCASNTEKKTPLLLSFAPQTPALPRLCPQLLPGMPLNL